MRGGRVYNSEDAYCRDHMVVITKKVKVNTESNLSKYDENSSYKQLNQPNTAGLGHESSSCSPAVQVHANSKHYRAANGKCKTVRDTTCVILQHSTAQHSTAHPAPAAYRKQQWQHPAAILLLRSLTSPRLQGQLHANLAI